MMPDWSVMQDARVLKSLFSALRGRPGASAAPKSVRAPRPKVNAWHAVSIIGGAQACPCAREYGPRRFLSADAPRFPLLGCDGRPCDCRYRHHQDRRAKPRRQLDRQQLGRPYSGTEQRVIPRGRRASDL